MKTVLVFGAFDPLHAGHVDFLRQAKALGDKLIVIVARDVAIRSLKKRQPYQSENDRLKHITQLSLVDKARLGDEDPTEYALLKTLDFDILALGYDQSPNASETKKLLHDMGKIHVSIIRLQPYFPERYKSSYLRE